MCATAGSISIPNLSMALLAPPATPRPVIDRLNARSKRGFKPPEVAQKVSAQTLDP
jgi:hypothetical protein